MGLLDMLVPNWQTPQQNAQDAYGATQPIAQGAGGILGQIVGFPRRYMETYQPGQSVRDDPSATNWAADMALNMVGTPGGVGGLGSGARFRAFHGSPHNFDKFDAAKIGTGEGAQVYGRGLYFAENPKVAESYKNNLSQKGGGKTYEVEIKADPEKFLPWDENIAANPEIA